MRFFHCKASFGRLMRGGGRGREQKALAKGCKRITNFKFGEMLLHRASGGLYVNKDNAVEGWSSSRRAVTGRVCSGEREFRFVSTLLKMRIL